MRNLTRLEELGRKALRYKVAGGLSATLIAVGGIGAMVAIHAHERTRPVSAQRAVRQPGAVPVPVFAPVAIDSTPPEVFQSLGNSQSVPLLSPGKTEAKVAVHTEVPKVVASTPAKKPFAPTGAVTKPPAFVPVADQALALAHADTAPVDHLAKADELEKSGDGKDALAEARQALYDKPNDPAALWRIATLDGGALGERALARLVKVSKSDAEAPLELAKRMLVRGDVPGAMAMALRACRLDPKSWQPWEVEGRAFLSQGQLGPAIAAFKKSTEQKGAPSYPYNNLGLALMLSGRYDGALQALNTAVDKGPVKAYMMNNLGLAYEKLGELDQAEVAYLGALELESDYVKAQVNLERVGNEKDALARSDKREKGEDAKASTGAGGVVTRSPSSGALVTEPGPLHGG